MEINHGKHSEGKLIPVTESLEYFGYQPDDLLEEADNARLELYVALKPFKAKLITVNNPESLIPDPTTLKASYQSGSGGEVPLLPAYAYALLRFKEAEVKSFPAEIPNDENLIYHWVLEEPQKINFSHVYVHSEHIVKNAQHQVTESDRTNTKNFVETP